MAETIFVTGATGTVGNEVVKQLSAKEQNVNVKATTHSVTNNTITNLNGVQVVQLDHNKPDTLAAAFKDVDKLFLLTPGQPNVVDLTTHLVNEAKNARVKHIVRLSTMGVDAICQVYYCP